MEKETNGSLPFLDVLITRQPDGTLGHSVYRKPTHTDRYLSARSFHPPLVKSSIQRTLVQAHNISDDQNLKQELQHVKEVLRNDGYKTHKDINQPRQPRNITQQKEDKNKTQEEDKTQEDIKNTAIIPYIDRASYEIQRILRQAINIKVSQTSSGKLHTKLQSHKDKPDSYQMTQCLPHSMWMW